MTEESVPIPRKQALLLDALTAGFHEFLHEYGIDAVNGKGPEAAHKALIMHQVTSRLMDEGPLIKDPTPEEVVELEKELRAALKMKMLDIYLNVGGRDDLASQFEEFLKGST